MVTAAEAKLFKIPEGTEVYAAKGCSVCNRTGYKGRLAIHEVLVIDGHLGEMISAGQTNADEIKEEAIKHGMRTLWDNALYNVLEGNTSLEEMLRVAYEQ